MKKLIAALLLVFSSMLPAQQPQAAAGTPLFNVNSTYTNGVAPGFWPTAGTGLTLNISAGTAFCSSSIVTYAGGTLAMTNSATNYIYLDTGASCVPASNTSSFSASNMPLAIVVASGGVITSITDVRTMFIKPGGASAPSFSIITSGTNTIAAMLCGTGCSLAPIGSGTVNANQVNGASVAASAAYAATNSSGQIVAAATPVTSIQMQNGGVNFGSPVTGAGTFNFVNCTVSGTSPSFTITCTGSGTVTTTGSPSSGQMTAFSGGTSITTATGHNVVTPLGCADSSGSGTAQVCTTSPSYTPTSGDCIIYTTTTPNSGTGLTLNVNSLGAKSVAKWMGSTTTLAANDVLANKRVLACYDGTNWDIDDIGNAPASGVSGSGTTGNPAAWTSSTALGNETAHNSVIPLACPDTSGSGTAQTCSTTPSFTPAAGDWIIYTTTTANTGDLTINVNSLGAVHVRKWLGAAVLASGDLPANTPMVMVYDGTFWEIPTIGNVPATGGSPVIKTKTANYTVLLSDWSAPCGWIIATANNFTITLTSTSTQPSSGTCIEISNRGAGEITVSNNGQNIGGNNGSFTIDVGQAAMIISDGTNYEAVMTASPWNWLNSGNSSTALGAGTFAGTSNNLSLGSGTGNSGMSGANNLSLGKGSGNQLSTGSNNLCIGVRACANGGPTSGSSDVIIDEANGGGDAHTPNPGDNNYYDFAGVFWGDRSKGIHIVYGPSNSVGSCGTGAARTSGSNDYTGEITVGTSSSNTCTVSFANTHNKAPFCVVSAHSLATVVGLSYSVSTTALTVTATSGLDSLVFDYVCPTGTTSHVPTP